MVKIDSLIYLDNNATTACAPEVLEAMLPFFTKEHGNPTSPHVMGHRASAAVARARDQIAEFIGCDSSEIYFTSGATESNNIVHLGLVSKGGQRRKIVTTAIEHKSVLGPCELLDESGYEVVRMPVNRDGQLDSEVGRQAIDEGTLLVSIQGANNEIGTIQPVRELAEVAHARGAFVHCDAAQLLGKVRCQVNEFGVDFASFSGHKVYGPKGIGVLFVKNGMPRSRLVAIFRGGNQEFALRPGTLNVPGIVGMGEACRLAATKLDRDIEYLSTLRTELERGLIAKIPKAFANACNANRLPGTASVTVPGVPADLLIANLPNICIGEGSACNSGTLSPSHVLLAMGHSVEEAECTIRLSIGRTNTMDEIVIAIEQITDVSVRLRAEMGR